MDQKQKEDLRQLIASGFIDAVLSNPTGTETLQKIKIRPVNHKGQTIYQIEKFTKTQAFHKNVSPEELSAGFPAYFENRFRQGQITLAGENIQILVSKKGAVSILRKKNKIESFKQLPLSHNRSKNYILNEGTPVPFLVELGVMTKDGTATKAKYDKFRQINRFLEFIRDVLPALPSDRPVTILDFGCGKSYLTFALYYYMKIICNRDIQVIGLDLKEKVIEDCNRLAKKYEYDHLTFITGDVSTYTGEAVDMVVTLHACDVATDYALEKAVRWGAKVILSVPCCQHELNGQMENDLLKPIFQYGIIKERTAALYTDAIRAQILESVGYRTQILEFIDMEHTPKNLLIRAVKQGNPKNNKKELEAIMKELHIEPMLYRLLQE